MKIVLVTGSRGFIGKNLVTTLSRWANVHVKHFDSNDDVSNLRGLFEDVNIVYHLVGVNCPKQVEAFERGKPTSLPRLFPC